MVWVEWFNSVVAGKNSFDLPFHIAESIDTRIALGEFRFDFWRRAPEEVNAEISGWVANERRLLNATSRAVFVSYNSADQGSAKEVGNFIDSFGFQSFAQYKDMPPGSNFIAEMQDGLATMGKFSPLYSPEYMASEICQAEWNAAYNMDRLGKRRLIIGFLLKPTKLLPLQMQVVHVPLYGLTKEKARAAILEALTGDGERASPAQSRKEAAESASPEPFVDEQGRIGVSSSAEVEAAFIDDELASLPESMRRLLANLLAALPSTNAPSMLSQNLSDYRTELLVNGSSPRMADLLRCAEIIKAEINDALELEAAWYRAGIKLSLEQFLELHEKLRQRFPLMMLRDQSIERSAIEPTVFDMSEFALQHKEFAKAASEAHREDLTTEEFMRVLEWRERQRKDIASLREPQISGSDDIFLTNKDRVPPAAIKKRFLFDMSGTGDKLLERTANVTKIADSGAGQMLIGATRELLKLIWGG
jgi:TIR domain